MAGTGGATGTATIVRAIMHFTFGTIVSNTARQQVALGIYVAGHEELAQTALNDPTADANQDWYYWTLRSLYPLAVSSNQVQWEVDLKTMRRLRTGYKLLMVVNNPINTVASELNLAARLLWKQQV